MYQRILLAFDGSAEGRAALAEGMELAALCKAEVHLLSVLDTAGVHGFGEGVHPLERFDHSGVAQLRTRVDASLEQLRAHGIAEPKGHIAFGQPLEQIAHIAFGQPLEQIAHLAARVEADLVVVGHRHRTRLQQWWDGSLSRELLDRLRCSLLIAAPRPAGPPQG